MDNNVLTTTFLFLLASEYIGGTHKQCLHLGNINYRKAFCVITDTSIGCGWLVVTWPLIVNSEFSKPRRYIKQRRHLLDRLIFLDLRYVTCVLCSIDGLPILLLLLSIFIATQRMVDSMWSV